MELGTNIQTTTQAQENLANYNSHALSERKDRIISWGLHFFFFFEHYVAHSLLCGDEESRTSKFFFANLGF